MEAMLVVKNNSLPLRWEKNFIFLKQILRKKIVLYWPPTWPPCHVGEIKELISTNHKQAAQVHDTRKAISKKTTFQALRDAV